MQAVLCLLLISCATVFGDFYFCPKENGDAFECFDYNKTFRTCLTDRRGNNYVTCGKCTPMWEFCVTREKIVKSKYPERDCGADYKSTPCTKANSYVSTVFKFRD